MDKFAINRTQQTEYTEGQEVKLGFIDPNTIFEVIDDEYEYGCKEIDGMDDGERQVELRCCYDQPMNDDYDIPLEYVLEIDIVFVVQSHAVVSHHGKVENHRNYPPDE